MFFYLSKIVWFLFTPSTFLTLLAAFGLFAGAFLNWRRLWLRLSFISLLCLLVLGLSPLSNAMMSPLEERFPRWRGEAPDGIVVLGGAITTFVSGERDVVTLNESAERMTEMIALAVRHPTAKIVFTGGTGSLYGEETTEAAIAARLFAESGLDPARLILEDRSRTTWENAVFTRALVIPKTGERWLLVTSAFHMPRAIGTFRAAGFPMEAYPVDYRASGAFPGVADGLKRADVAAKEWAGLFAYWASGRMTDLFPAP